MELCTVCPSNFCSCPGIKLPCLLLHIQLCRLFYLKLVSLASLKCFVVMYNSPLYFKYTCPVWMDARVVEYFVFLTVCPTNSRVIRQFVPSIHLKTMCFTTPVAAVVKPSSFAPELVSYWAPRDLHRRAAKSICEPSFLINHRVFHNLFVCP